MTEIGKIWNFDTKNTPTPNWSRQSVNVGLFYGSTPTRMYRLFCCAMSFVSLLSHSVNVFQFSKLWACTYTMFKMRKWNLFERSFRKLERIYWRAKIFLWNPIFSSPSVPMSFRSTVSSCIFTQFLKIHRTLPVQQHGNFIHDQFFRSSTLALSGTGFIAYYRRGII